MISRSDYIAIATPLTPETRGLIGETEFAAMKPTAVVINVGRGQSSTRRRWCVRCEKTYQGRGARRL